VESSRGVKSWQARVRGSVRLSNPPDPKSISRQKRSISVQMNQFAHFSRILQVPARLAAVDPLETGIRLNRPCPHLIRRRVRTLRTSSGWAMFGPNRRRFRRKLVCDSTGRKTVRCSARQVEGHSSEAPDSRKTGSFLIFRAAPPRNGPVRGDRWMQRRTKKGRTAVPRTAVRSVLYGCSYSGFPELES